MGDGGRGWVRGRQSGWEQGPGSVPTPARWPGERAIARCDASEGRAGVRVARAGVRVARRGRAWSRDSVSSASQCPMTREAREGLGSRLLRCSPAAHIGLPAHAAACVGVCMCMHCGPLCVQALLVFCCGDYSTSSQRCPLTGVCAPCWLLGPSDHIQDARGAPALASLLCVTGHA